MKLHYVPGSPFARMIRVLLRELMIECEEFERVEFPPSTAYFAINPLGQVPSLETKEGILFPTRLIIDYLLEMPREKQSSVARAVRRDVENWQDEQTLSVVLAMGDAMATMKYQQWAGLEPQGENLIGDNPAQRHCERIMQTLDWLEHRSASGGFIPGVLSAHDIAFACLLLWTDARGGFPWRGRPGLEAIVDHCSERPSFLATAPQIWP